MLECHARAGVTAWFKFMAVVPIHDGAFLRQCFIFGAFTMRLWFCFPVWLVLLLGTLATAHAQVNERGQGVDKPRVAGMVIQTVVTPLPQPTLAPKPASPEPVAAAPVPSVADDMVKVEPPRDQPDAPAAPANDKILQTDSQNRMSAPARASKITAYAGAGTSVVLGLNIPGEGGLNYRVEYSDGFKSVGASKTYGGGKYIETNTQQRLGFFVDWSPGENNWAVTGGVTLNKQQFQFQAKPGSSMTIDGKNVPNFTGQSFSIDYSLPKLTPYLGVRYAHQAMDRKGWEGFAELGAVLAKLDGEARISPGIYPAPVTDSDVRAEVNTIRQAIYKWGVVPNALVGLSYRY